MTTAQADNAKQHRFNSGWFVKDYQSVKHDSRRFDDRRFRNKQARRQQVLRLDLPVRVRGSDRVKLGRLLNYHYNIDLNNYRLRKVVVDNHGRRHASAVLRTGPFRTNETDLNRGRTHITAPGDADRWIMRFHNARVDNIRVVLEPRHRYVAYRDTARGDGRFIQDRRYRRWH